LFEIRKKKFEIGKVLENNKSFEKNEKVVFIRYNLKHYKLT